MADKSTQLILAALSRAAAAGAAVPLFAGKSAAGLFPAGAAGRQAAQRCQDEGYLSPAPTAESPMPPAEGGGVAVLARKKSAVPLCTLTEKGLAYLLSQVSPRQVLEDFVRALESRRQHTDHLLGLVRQEQQGIDAMKAGVEKVLHNVCRAERGGNLKELFADFRSEPAPAAGEADALHAPLLAELSRWHDAGASEDCPLPQLYRRLAPRSIGLFHDALRQLHDLGKVYLHPWTGPLYDIPEPAYALLVGHEIAYYASIRCA